MAPPEPAARGADDAPSSDYACYLINLDRSTDRLARQDRRLRELAMPYERIAAVDGRLLPPAEFARLTARNRYYKPLIPGEVGCYLSHVAALQRFLDSPHRYALILEDDVVLPDRIDEIVRAAIALRERGSLGRIGHWHLLKLQAWRKRRVRLSPLATGYELVEYAFSVPTATAAAVWCRDGAERFLSRFSGVFRPIDCELQHPWEYGLAIRSVHPPLVRTEGASQIGKRKRHSTRLIDKLRYEARRLLPKWAGFSERYGAFSLLPLLLRGEAGHRSYP